MTTQSLTNHHYRPLRRPGRRRPTAELGLLVAAVLLGGCAESSASTSPTSSTQDGRSPTLSAAGVDPGLPVATASALFPAESATPEAPTNRGLRPDAGRIDGVWEGEYVCGQGSTGLRLTVAVVSDTAVEATFDFYPLPTNPAVPSGSFAMRGTFTGDQLTVEGERWIVQPASYVMVGLQAEVPDGDVTALHGSVDGPNCSTFSVSRTQ